MKKLLELKSLDTEVRELLHTVETPPGIYICLHMHYAEPTISIYYTNSSGKSIPYRVLAHNSIVYYIEDTIDEQVVDEIIVQIEKVMQ